MKPKERKQRFSEYRETVTKAQMAKLLDVTEQTVTNYERELGECLQVIPEAEPETLVKTERKVRKLTETSKEDKRKLKYLEDENEKLERALEAVLQTSGGIKPLSYKPRKTTKLQRAVPFIVASDWHYEELVDSDTVAGLNEYNLAIARLRIRAFWQNSLKLLQKQTRDVKTDKVVLALLGDFISGSIHDELMESNQLPPAFAIIEVQELIAGGIQYLLDNTTFSYYIPCHTGNHGRMGERRIATEAGNSLEYYMYYNLRNHFAGNPRVSFYISKGYHSYVEVFDYTVRFHHGHNIRYGGGVGGATIPTLKAIANWNTGRWADYDVFGHLHHFFPADTFIINGSIIGWNAFAISIKAKYSKHTVQTFFLIQEGKGRTIVAPIFCE